MANPFFDFFKTDQNAPIFCRTVIIYQFIRKIVSKVILDLGKCPNRKMHESESACFLVRADECSELYTIRQYAAVSSR